MIHRLRPLLFWLFVGAFFVTATTVIFYTFGYRFNIGRGIFIYTGSISIKSNPGIVDITIDGEAIPQAHLGILNNSIHIAGLAPGEHFLEVSAPGYRLWTKKAVVRSGLTTEFWNVLLVKENYAPLSIPNTDHVIRLFRAPANKLFALVRKNGTVYSVDTLDMNTGDETQVFSTSDAVITPDNDENIEWSPESHKLTIPVTQAGVRAYYVVDIATKNAQRLSELTQIKDPLHSPRWDPTTKNILFFLGGATLYSIDTESPESAPLRIKEGVQAYDLSSQNMYYLSSENGTVYETPLNATESDPEQITLTPVNLDPLSSYALIVYDKDRLTILNRSTGSLSVFNRNTKENPLVEFGTGVRGSQFSDDGKKLLFFTDNEISVYFLSDWEVQPIRLANTTMQIARFSSSLQSVQWTKDYEHVLFALNGNVKIVELDNRDRRNLTDVITYPAPILQILSRFEENQIYFVRSDNADQNTVESIGFPQITGLFGLQ